MSNVDTTIRARGTGSVRIKSPDGVTTLLQVTPTDVLAKDVSIAGSVTIAVDPASPAGHILLNITTLKGDGTAAPTQGVLVSVSTGAGADITSVDVNGVGDGMALVAGKRAVCPVTTNGAGLAQLDIAAPSATGMNIWAYGIGGHRGYQKIGVIAVP